MAGERKGKAYEALVFSALNRLNKAGEINDSIFWNKKPSCMSIEPDFTIGKNENELSSFIMVTHGGSVKESNRKYWRNTGELVEIKTNFPNAIVVSIIFDDLIKDDIKKLESATFDKSVIVAQKTYWPKIRSFVDANSDMFPKNDLDKVEIIESHAKKDKELTDSLDLFMNDIALSLSRRNTTLDKLWAMDRSRKRLTPPVARQTFVRRGLAKAGLFGCIPEEKKIYKNCASWMTETGLVIKTLSGYRVKDPELIWAINAGIKIPDFNQFIKLASTDGFLQQLIKIRSLVLLDEFSAYVTAHLTEIKTQKGMLKHLRLQYKNPQHGLSIPANVDPPTNVWLFDFITAVLKAKSGLSQGFGYSAFAKHQKAKQSLIGNMDIGSWCSCFMNQYVSRRDKFNAPKEAEEFFALVLSDAIQKVTEPDIKKSTESILKEYIAKEYEATLLSHRGFDPIGALLAIKCGFSTKHLTRIQGCFAESALSNSNSGTTSVLKVKNTIINWQSASDAGRDHKKKELCGRAVALRYSWDTKAKSFITRPGIAKLVLIVDGTWRQDDLNALIRAGWDEIYYLDELDQVTKSIV